jgi:hypothetical protein
MNFVQIVASLERQRRLLADFRSVSESQLGLIEMKDVYSVRSLLRRRSDLLLELAAIEATLGTWVAQIRNDRSITHEVIEQLRLLCDEIVDLATEIISIDEETQRKIGPGRQIRSNSQ